MPSRRDIQSRGDHRISIEYGGRTYSGAYNVESRVLSLWVDGPYGTAVGPITQMLRGVPPKVAAENLLREYAKANR